MLYDTSTQRTKHHRVIKQLTGIKEVQRVFRGRLPLIARALEREQRRVERNSRKKAVYLAEKAGFKKKCLLCGSLEELELDHIDKNPRNNDLSNLRYLCVPCHRSRHGLFKKREDYKRCFSCKKIRVCDTYNQILLCSACSLKLGRRWKAETNSNVNVVNLLQTLEFKKWIESLYSFQ